MSENWKSPGSKWWRFDFHAHTPKSDDYGRGEESLKGVEPEEWLRKAMQSGLDCVVVTDHNSGGWIDALQAKNNELRDRGTQPDWYRELTIIPGVEITVDRLAKVAGSDAHKPDEIGRHFSWLKMSRPSIEGLRLALLDHEFCVKNQTDNPNHLPDVFLSKLTIQAMHHCGRISGQPFVTEFHPHFNAVIGGRGTGKSTLVESIRIVSRRDQVLSFEAPRVKDELDTFMKHSQNKGVMLDDTEILLDIHRRGKDFRLRWRFDGQGAVLEEQTDSGCWQEISPGDLNERFPISIFSQKQINELASNPRGLLEVVDRSFEVNRAEWKSRWESAKSRFLQLREQRRELCRQLSGEQQLRAKLRDFESDLKQYEEKGHGEVLKQYQRRSQQKNGLPDHRIFDDLSAGIRELGSQAELSDFPAHLFDDQDETTAEIRSIHEQTAQEVKNISDELGKLAEIVDALKNRQTERITSSKWHQVVEASIIAYDELVMSTMEDEYRALLNLDDGKFISSVCDRESRQGILWPFLQWEEAKTPESDLPQVIASIKSETSRIANGQIAGNHGPFDNRLKRLLETQPAIFDQLDAWWPEDMLRVKYSKDPSTGKFDDLGKGSAGQKAAAIMAFLLSHGSEPLVIDQPEDDLDNGLNKRMTLEV